MFLRKKAYLESGDTKMLNPNFVYQLVKNFEKKGYEYFYEPKIPPMRQYHKISLPIYKADTHTCRGYRKRIYRYFNMINTVKYEVCLRAKE